MTIITPRSNARAAQPTQVRLPGDDGGGAALSQVGQQMQRLGAEHEARCNATAMVESTVVAQEALAEIDIDFADDTDFGTVGERHNAAIDERHAPIVAAAPEAIREKLALQLRSLALPHRTGVARRALDGQRAADRATFSAAQDRMIDASVAASDPAVRAAALSTVRTAIQDAVASGTLTPAEGIEQITTLAERGDTGMANRMQAEDPAALVATLAAGGLPALDPVTRARMQAQATSAMKTRADIADRERAISLSEIQSARALGSALDDEADRIAALDASGHGEEARRAVAHGSILSTFGAMDTAAQQAVLDEMKGNGIADRAEIGALADLTQIHEARILAERILAEKNAKEAREAWDKADAQQRKALEKRFDEVIEGLQTVPPIVLAGAHAIRAMARGTEHEERFENAWTLAGITSQADGGNPDLASADLADLPHARDLAYAKAKREAVNTFKASRERRAADPMQYGLDKPGAGVAPFDISDPASARRRVAAAPAIWSEDAGLDRRYLSDVEADTARQTFDSANSDERAALIAGMTATVGSASTLDIMREVGIADPFQRHAAQYLAASDDRRLYLEAQRGADRARQTGERISPTVRKRVRAAVIGGIFGPQHATQEAGAMADALYAARSGNTDPEDEAVQEDIYTLALEEALGGKVASFGAGRVLLPLGIDSEQAQDALSMLASEDASFLDLFRPFAKPLGVRKDDEPPALPDLSRIGTGGAPDIGGAPMPRHLFSRARYRPVGDGLFEMTVLNSEHRALPVMRDDRPDEPWTLDLRALVALSEAMP